MQTEGGLSVRQIRVGPMQNFVYLLTDVASGEALVVDSGWETGPLLDAAKEQRAKVKYAVASHEHFDHTATLGELAAKTGAEVAAYTSSPLDCSVRLSDGDELVLGKSRVKVLHTPGHTEDSVCLFDGTRVFTGDTLFVGEIGRFQARDAESIYRSLYEVVMKLPDATVVLPGHDYGDSPTSTVSRERASNPYLSARSFKGFLSSVS